MGPCAHWALCAVRGFAARRVPVPPSVLILGKTGIVPHSTATSGDARRMKCPDRVDPVMWVANFQELGSALRGDQPRGDGPMRASLRTAR